MNRILQPSIIPADGWRVVFNEGGKLQDYLLTLWAVVEGQHGDRFITGIIKAGVHTFDVEDDPDFVAYLPPNVPVETLNYKVTDTSGSKFRAWSQRTRIPSGKETLE